MTNPIASAPQPAAADERPASLADVAAALDGAHAVGPVTTRFEDVVLTDVALDSRAVRPGGLFACRPGARTDGHDHAPEAVAAGAVALLVERALELEVPQLAVPAVADGVGLAAAVVHGRPSTALDVVGVTGTNGKTTSAYLIEAGLRASGHRTGLIGTVETLVDGHTRAGVRTTPEATDLQRLLHEMRQAGVSGVAMEVSSHGLALGRVRGTRFAVAVFTNLSQDHLDFHRDLEDYFAAKAQLFATAYTERAVINVDGPYGERLARIAADRGVDVVRVSASGHPEADVRAERVRLRGDGSDFEVALGTRRVPVTLRLPGGFNVANALGALVAVTAVGGDLEAVAAGLASVPGVPGRMERVDRGQPFTVLVDYAHTPDSVEHVLRAARELTRSQLIVVVGCGGDRDRGKRAPMGRAAASLADLAVFTSDNPRTEDPDAILEAMVAGARDVEGRWTVEPSRAEAIRTALDAAGPGDVVVIAGKGHEATQEFADRTVPFDDRAVAAELLGRRWGGAPEGAA